MERILVRLNLVSVKNHKVIYHEDDDELLGRATTSVCHFFHPSVPLSIRRIQDFFQFFKILIFWAVKGVKGQKKAQNEK